MNFHKNIKFLRKRRKRTQDEMAHALSMKRSTLSGYENEVAQPNIPVLISFSNYYNISIDTLIKIDLSKLPKSQLLEIERGFDVYVTGGKLRVLTTTVDSENEENIELVPEKAQAGYTTGFADPEFIGELSTFRLPFLSKERKYRTFQIKGDSMFPIPEGTWITGEYVNDWNAIKTNTAHIILTYDNGIVFKVIENKLRENKTLKLHSLNPAYDPYEINANEIREIWRFANYICNELPEPVFPKNDLINAVASLKKDMNKIKGFIKL